MNKISCRIDYLRFTVHGLGGRFFNFWDEFFREDLGPLEDTGHGSKGFVRVYHSGNSAFVHIANESQGDYFSVELRGQACACLHPNVFRGLADLVRSYQDYPCQAGEVKINFTRVDFAVDHVPFTPYMLYQHVQADLVTGRFQRKGESVRWNSSPYQWDDLENKQGCDTLYLGNRQSGRMVRCYDRRGYTRLEIELKEDYAGKYFLFVASHPFSEWLAAVKGVFLDYLSVEAAWWAEFMDAQQKTGIRLENYGKLTLQRVRDWIEKQVAPSLLAFRLIDGNSQFEDWISKEGSKNKRMDRVRTMIELAKGQDNEYQGSIHMQAQ